MVEQASLLSIAKDLFVWVEQAGMRVPNEQAGMRVLPPEQAADACP
ncbi:MAG: hypothetical protein ACPGWR_21650 [Ardenticatenaceae bacterium]